MRPEHLDLLYAAGNPSLTPDGAMAVVPVIRPDTKTDMYRGGLWVVPTTGGPARRLTNGERDVAPSVSPDGRRVAFLRAGKESPPQIHVTAIDGGEPQRLTDHPLGAGAPRWSPDGARLTYSARVPESGRYGTKDAEGEEIAADAEPARLITELAYRLDDVGFTRDRRAHVFVLDVPEADDDAGNDLPKLPVTSRQVTTGDHDDEHPAWSPDGTTLAFVSARHESRESDLRSALHAVRADASDPIEEPGVIFLEDLSVSAFRWLPDHRLVVAATAVGSEGRDFAGRSGQLFVTTGPVLPDSGPADLRALTAEDEFDIEAGPDGIALAGERVVVTDLHRGAVRLLSVDLDDPEADAEVVLDGHVAVRGHASSGDGTTLVVAAADAGRNADLGVVRDGDVQWLTDVSARLRAEGVATPREVEASSADGYPVHGWVLLPDAGTFGPGPHPVLLNIHGGPQTQYDWGLFDEAQVYAGAGYAVVMCNPRGSSGYGLQHSRSIRHAMGTVDADDIVAFLDHTLADPAFSLDPDRVGVMGGSYGGYMTALLTTRTKRFAAAVVERGYLDGSSFVGSSDIGWFFPEEYHGDAEAMTAQTPMSRVDEVTTPTLVIHSETDWRTPVEQGQRWFTALRTRGIRTELLLFPGEGHELSRSGRPRHRRQRFEHILRWWDEHLPVG
jgi:dipeptidyl aminopeptidase/acylaminoacyl peptidase